VETGIRFSTGTNYRYGRMYTVVHSVAHGGFRSLE
jgi:hypothetical protein